MKNIIWNVISTRLLLAILLVCTLLITSPNQVNAQITCTSDLWGMCGPPGGCLNGYICAPSAGNPSCVINPDCGAPDPVQDPPAPVHCGDAGTGYQYGAAGGCSNSDEYCQISVQNGMNVGECVLSPENAPDPTPLCSKIDCIGGCYAIGQCQNQKTCVMVAGKLAPSGGSCDIVEEVPKPTLDIFGGPGANDFKLLNPLQMFGSPYADTFSSPAGIINRVLKFAFPLAGLILFVMIVWGGFEVLSGATNSKGVQAGKQRITAALLGFGLLFISFWIIQIVEYIFNLAIL